MTNTNKRRYAQTSLRLYTAGTYTTLRDRLQDRLLPAATTRKIGPDREWTSLSHTCNATA